MGSSNVTQIYVKLVIVILVVNLRQFNCDCGFPGIPNGADIENPENTKFTENTTVIYRCRNHKDRTLSILQKDIMDRDPFTGYIRTCLKGQWVEPLPRCGELLMRIDHR